MAIHITIPRNALQAGSYLSLIYAWTYAKWLSLSANLHQSSRILNELAQTSQDKIGGLNSGFA
ncbi:MAG: hypothetical protein HZC39_03735 [Chloroflexi bacterium]|nr:hypothetical protein [Chloroflexota bacterium]MBI5702617.1 hypothetical protein [Chloroflexota bacterium]